MNKMSLSNIRKKGNASHNYSKKKNAVSSNRTVNEKDKNTTVQQNERKEEVEDSKTVLLMKHQKF